MAGNGAADNQKSRWVHRGNIEVGDESTTKQACRWEDVFRYIKGFGKRGMKK